MSGAEAKKVRDFCTEHDITLFNFLLSAYNILLHRLSGQDDIVVGALRVNRHLPDIENMIGITHNNLVLRSKIESSRPFLFYLGQTRQKLLSAMENSEYSFDYLVENNGPAGI